MTAKLLFYMMPYQLNYFELEYTIGYWSQTSNCLTAPCVDMAKAIMGVLLSKRHYLPKYVVSKSRRSQYKYHCEHLKAKKFFLVPAYNMLLAVSE
jgi:hypothetical protein